MGTMLAIFGGYALGMITMGFLYGITVAKLISRVEQDREQIKELTLGLWKAKIKLGEPLNG